MPDKAVIGERIKKMRESKKLSQEMLSQAIGINRATLGMYEIGARKVSDENKIKIANYFHKSVEDIFFTP